MFWHPYSIPKEDVVYPRLLYSDAECFQTCCRRFWACCWHCQALTDLSSALADASSYTYRPLHWSSELRDLTTMVLWSENSAILPETPREIIKFCSCNPRKEYYLCQRMAIYYNKEICILKV